MINKYWQQISEKIGSCHLQSFSSFTFKNIFEFLENYGIMDAIIPYKETFVYTNKDLLLIKNSSESWKENVGIFYDNETVGGQFLEQKNLKEVRFLFLC